MEVSPGLHLLFVFIQDYSEQSNPANTDTEGTIVHIKQVELGKM